MKKALWLAGLYLIPLMGNPSNPSVIAGAATFTSGVSTLIVEASSDRTIVEWEDFSIGATEITHFKLPSVTSAILNRVTSLTPSALSGLLTSNGEVFLINPNGILIGNQAKIDTNVFVASALDALNSEFLNSQDISFSGTSTAAVENNGMINGREGVFLLARHIVNAGEVHAGQGVVGLGGGDSILLLADKSGIMINLTAGTPSGTGVVQSGGIDSNRCSIKANGNLYSLAIHHPGWATSLTTTDQTGEITLRADGGETLVDGSGQLFVQGLNGMGGRVSIEGKTVTIQDQVDINVSNLAGGGTVYIGGSAGADPSILDAANTTVTESVKISADAHVSGDGGNVVVYATDTATFAGSITARGGAAGGDGGEVEISGIGNLNYTGTVDTTAVVGLTGLLTLDPTDITISGAATAGGTFDGSSPTNTFSGTAAAATLNITDLNTALNTNNVVVTTTSPFGGVGNITWSTATPLTLTASHNLTLLAGNNITISSNFTMVDSAAGTSNVTFNAGNNITLTSAVTATNLASVQILAGNDVLLDNAINASGATLTVTSGNDIISQGAANNTLLSDVCTFNATGDITLTNELNSTGNGSNSTLFWTAGDQIFINNDIDFLNWGTATLSTTSGDLIIDQAVVADNVGTLTLNAGRDLISQGGSNALNDTAVHVTDLVLNADRDILINSPISINDFNSATISAGNDFNNAAGFTITNLPTLGLEAENDINITASTNVTGASTTVSSGNDTNILEVFVNNGSGDIAVTTGNDLNVGPSTSLSQLGSRLGDLSLEITRDLNVLGGTTSSDRSQIGFNASLVDSDISMVVGRDINVIAGDNSSCVAQIGHGFSVAGTYSGDIILQSIGGDVNITGGPSGPGSVKFAQIGFTRNASPTNSTFTGDIRGAAPGSYAQIQGALNLTGGGDSTSYALFGHGGRDSNSLETYSGEVRVRAGSINLTGGTATNSNASIGYFAGSMGGGTNFVTITDAIVAVISDTDIPMTAQTDGIVSIGARVLNTASHPASINLDLVQVETGGDLLITSGTVDTETDATIGAFAEFGFATTPISMEIGGDLNMAAQTASPARILNGISTTAADNVNIIVAGNLTASVAGGFGSFIDAVTGNLNVRVGGVITMPDPLTFIRNSGGNNGTVVVEGGNIFLLSGGSILNLGSGTSLVRTTSGDLNLLDGGSISSVGSLSGSIAADLNLRDNATITTSAGVSQFSVGKNIDISGGSGGSSFITSSGSGIYTAGNTISISGISTTNTGGITNSTGSLALFAGEDMVINFYGNVENLGAGSLTIVSDNDFPMSPEIGPGGFILSSLGSVGRLGGGVMRIFTARRSQNRIEGTNNLNGLTFVPGSLFVDSATEQWDTYYPSSFGGVPFTIFYKDDIAPTPADILVADPNAFVPFSELFYLLNRNSVDPVVAWFDHLCIVSCTCIPQKYRKEPTLRVGYQLEECKFLPPYEKRFRLKPF